jgi:hypothetical protein
MSIYLFVDWPNDLRITMPLEFVLLFEDGSVVLVIVQLAIMDPHDVLVVWNYKIRVPCSTNGCLPLLLMSLMFRRSCTNTLNTPSESC